MASRNELEVNITSARDLKNVNWRNGLLRPYAVVWVDPCIKSSTRVDEDGDTCPQWDQTLTIPLPGGPITDHTLHIDIVHAGRDPDTKPLIGSARLRLSDVIEEVGLGERFRRSLQLKRPSGRPQGKLEVKVTIRDPRYRAADPHYAPPYGVAPLRRQHSYGGSAYDDAPPYGVATLRRHQSFGGSAYDDAPPYGAAVLRSHHSFGGSAYDDAPPPPPPNPYALPSSRYPSSVPTPAPYPAPPSGYPSSAPPMPAYSQGSYSHDSYGGQQQPQQPQPPVYKRKSSFGGMGTGLAVGAVGGLLGGLAIAEGIDAVEDHVAEQAAEKVEADLGYDDGGFGGDDF